MNFVRHPVKMSLRKNGLAVQRSEHSRQRDHFVDLIVPSTGDRLRGQKELEMLGAILIVILILFLLGALPRWGYSRSWGYGPTGLLGIVLLVVIALVVFGKM